LKRKTRRSLQKIISSILTSCLLITGLPIAGSMTAAAEAPSTMAKLSQEDDPEYEPFTWDEDTYNAIVAKSSDIHDIGKLPDYNEFKALTGYQGLDYTTLTEFRDLYGTGSAFSAPPEEIRIAVCSNDELDLLSALVNHTADSETAAEQSYYSTADYVLGTELRYTNTKFKPIGTNTYPFNGSFDGQNFEINGLSINGETAADYDSIGYFGLFGYIGSDGMVENIGVTSMTVDLPYVVGADAGFLCGRNYGTIRNCYVNSKFTSIMRISNATAGGISAENYGTIERCYADAWIQIDVQSGSYSEPQPIATVNNGTVTNCYYLKHQLSSYYVPSRNYDLTTDTNKSRCMVGWKYSGNANQINGTGLPLYEFLHLSEYLPNFSNGGTAYSTSYPYDQDGTCHTPSELEEILGTGSHFNQQYKQVFSSTPMYIKVLTNEEQVIYNSHVNRTVPQSDEEYNIWKNAYVYTTPRTNYSTSRNYNNYYEIYIDFYPTLGKPEQDENGVYLISSVPNFLWLIKCARNDKARLTKSIDLSNIVIDYIPNGSFELDGTLTDISDICGSIDLGVTKCYGLLNLTIKNGKFAKKADLSNVYLIGGQFILNSNVARYTTYNSYYIGETLENFHTSMTIDVSVGNSGDYYWSAMAKEAHNSSISSLFVVGHSFTNFYPLAYTCSDCVCYTRFESNLNYINPAYGMGCEIEHSISRVSANAYGNQVYLYGLGKNVVNSLADGEYNFRNKVCAGVLGQNCTDCTFSGKYYGNDTSMKSSCALGYKGINIAITENALIDGTTSGLFPNNSGNHTIFFGGTWNTYIVDGVGQSLFGTYQNDVTAYGKVNIHPILSECKNTTNQTYVKMGLNKVYGSRDSSISLMGSTVNGIQNNIVRFVDCDGIAFPYFTLSLWGSACHSWTDNSPYIVKKNRCYTNLNLDGSYYINTVNLTGYYDRLDDEYYQYGDIFIGDNAYIRSFTGIRTGYKRSANFGNVEIRNGYSLDFSLLAGGGIDREYINYGDVVFSKSKHDEIPAFYDLCVIGGTAGSRKSINYGNLTVEFADGIDNRNRLTIYDSYGLQVGDLNVIGYNCNNDLNIYGSSFSNYGNIHIRDIHAYNLTVTACFPYAIANTSNNIRVTGNIDIKNISRIYKFTYNTFFYTAERNYNNPEMTDILHSEAVITIDNVTSSESSSSDRGIFINNGIDSGLSGRHVNLTADNTITVKNVVSRYPFTFTGCSSFIPNDYGYKHNGSSIHLENLNVGYINYSGITSCHSSYPHQEWVNSSNLSIVNADTSAESVICGISSAKDKYLNESYGISQNCYNIGSMDIEINNAPVVAAGISRGAETNTSTYNFKQIVLNSSNISIKSNCNVDASGIQYTPKNRYEQSKIYNAVNDGTITVTQTGGGTVNIDGITNACNTIRSVENLADIETNCTQGQITAIAGQTSDCVGWVNYGQIKAANMFGNGYISCLIGKDEEAITEYGINYGVIPDAKSLDNITTNYIIDLSGNQETVPVGIGTFSTDSSIQGISNSASIRINDFDAAVRREYSEANDLTHSKYIGYPDILQPEFGLRYNNVVTPMYITEAKKQTYNEFNLFEYADKDELKGILKSTVDTFGDYGGYVLTATDMKEDACFGVDLEAMLFEENTISEETIPEWWSEYSIGEQLFKDYVLTRLLQREKGTIYEVYDISMESIDSYTTKSGGTAKITNKSSLIPFQAPIDGDDDGAYSQNTIVTIVDEYILVNEFTDIVGKTVRWKITPNGTVLPDPTDTVHLYENPIFSDNAEDFKQSIKTLLANEGYLANDLPESSYTELPVQDIGGTTYAIIGCISSEDGRRTNVIAMRLNSTTTDPLGWATSLVYPTGYEINGYSFDTVSTDAFGGSQSYYDDTKGYEPFETDKTTVEKITNTEKNYSYPKYTITQNMLHTTDHNNTSAWSMRWNETSPVSLKFRVQNVTDYTITLEGDGKTFCYTEDITEQNGEASADGTVVIKTIDKELTSEDFKTTNNVSLSTSYDSNNPFLYGGIKTVTVTGHNASGDESVLFVIELPKSESIENYIKDDNVLRSWIKYHSSEPTDNFSDQPLDIRKISGTYFLDKTVSTLAAKSNYKAEISELKQHGDYTKYPENIFSYVDVTAENGDTVTYLRNDKIVDFEKVAFKSIYYPWGSGNAFTDYNNNTIVLNEGHDSFTTYLWIDNSQVTGLQFSNVLLPDGTTTDMRFVFDKIDVYIDGSFDHTMNAVEGSKNLQMYDSMYDITFGADVADWASDAVMFRLGGNVPLNELPDLPITFKIYMKHTTLDGQEIKIQLENFTFAKKLDSNYQLIGTKLNRAISTTIVSDKADELSDHLEMGTDGMIIYNVAYQQIEHIYIDDAVEPNCTSSRVEYAYSPLASLQYYDGSSWRTVSSAESPYQAAYTFTFEGLQRGYTYEYRILAQDYNTGTNAAHVTYFTHRIHAVTRNKTLTIEFNEDDQTTMSLYDEIIGKNGNLSVQVKNMNVDQIRMQQTKFYKSNADLESNYYNISQGDFAVLVNLPAEYTYQIRIVGGSTEGYLKDSKIVKGKQLRLPYANAQNIKLVITLESSTSRNWGVSYDRSLYKSIRQNNI